MLKAVFKKIGSSLAAKAPVAKASSYISAVDTVAQAKANQLSVCDYVEKIWDQQGQTDLVINKINTIVQLPASPAIVEIGTGTGRYLEKAIGRLHPGSYESYEIAEDWNDYLRVAYPSVKVFQAAGASLANTPDRSTDLVMAHGVFTYLPFLVAVAYFNEINRVSRVGAYCIFDCFTEACFEHNYLQSWLQSKHEYPVLLPDRWVKNFFEKMSYRYVDGFNNKYGQGISQYLIFQKNA